MNKFYLSKEMAEAQPAGITSPGPVYKVGADAKYSSVAHNGHPLESAMGLRHSEEESA